MEVNVLNHRRLVVIRVVVHCVRLELIVLNESMDAQIRLVKTEPLVSRLSLDRAINARVHAPTQDQIALLLSIFVQLILVKVSSLDFIMMKC
jgi:hypothetical protein